MKLIEKLKTKKAQKLIKQLIGITLLMVAFIGNIKTWEWQWDCSREANIYIYTSIFFIGVMLLLSLIYDFLMERKDIKFMNLMIRLRSEEKRNQSLKNLLVSQAHQIDQSNIDIFNNNENEVKELNRRLNNAIDMNNQHVDKIYHLEYSIRVHKGNYTRLKAEHLRLKEMVDCVVENI